MQAVESSSYKCRIEKYPRADDTIDSVESIYGQHVPRMRLLNISYVNPHFDGFTDASSKPKDRLENVKVCHAVKKDSKNVQCKVQKCPVGKSNVQTSSHDTWNVKIAIANGLNAPHITGIVSRSNRISQIEKLNEQENMKVGHKKPSSDILKIDKIFEEVKKVQKCDRPSSTDKKIKKLAHEMQYKCYCDGKGVRKTTTSEICMNQNKFQHNSSNSDNPVESSEEKTNKQIQKLFESRNHQISRIPAPKQLHRQNKYQQLPVDQKKCAKRSTQMERIHLRKSTRRRQPLLIFNHVETSSGLLNQPGQTIIEKSEHKNRQSCGYKNCTFLNCPISQTVAIGPLVDKDMVGGKTIHIEDYRAPFGLSEKKDNLINSKKLENEVKVASSRSSEVVVAIVSPPPDKTNNLNDVQNLSGKNLTKASADKVLLSLPLNNTVFNKNAKAKAEVDVNLKYNENRKFNDLKARNNVQHHQQQHSLKIFVKNSPLSNRSLSSDVASSSIDSDKDDGYYDQVPSSEDSSNDVRVSSCTNNRFPSKLGCDGAIFWNNCYFYDENYCASCCPGRQKDLAAMQSDCICSCPPQKPEVHDLRPRSMDGGLDSGVSINGDTGSSPDSDILSQHSQSQPDLEARRLKRGHVLSELLETERIYVTEMNSILKGYRDQMLSEDMSHLVPPSLQGKEDILFGNLHELYAFHSEIFLKDLENCISTTELVALCFVQRRDTFYRLYSFYCQNIPRSERLRETLVDAHLFLQECQKRLGHKLPLAAYLLKPVQRITKYQLLLKDLLKFSDSGTCTKELQKALDCMLIVLKCVNDSMHQIAITGFPADLSQQGELLLQDAFQVWTESKKDIRLRLKTQHRHIFLYQKAMLFCKQASKTGHNKSTYQFKHYLKMSQIGLTESVRGDPKRFEVWLQGRQEVHTLQASTIDIKNKWVAEIKRVLLNQLEELKGEKIKQYGLNHRPLRQTVSWDTPVSALSTPQRAMSCDTESHRRSNGSDEGPNQTPGISSSSSEKDNQDIGGWSSDYSNSEDELSIIEDNSTPGSRFIALADYCAVGHSEVSMKEGDTVELLKVGCAGWWFVKVLDANAEGWTPAAYLEPTNRKTSRSSSRNQDRIN